MKAIIVKIGHGSLLLVLASWVGQGKGKIRLVTVTMAGISFIFLALPEFVQTNQRTAVM